MMRRGFDDLFRKTDVLMKQLTDFENGLFSDSFFSVPAKMTGALPKMNIIDKKDAYIVEAAVPGLCKENIEVEVIDNNLRISTKSEEKEVIEDADKGYIFKELSNRSFSRVMPLPEKVAEDRIQAKLDNGMLLITIPKAEQKKIKSRKVDIV